MKKFLAAKSLSALALAVFAAPLILCAAPMADARANDGAPNYPSHGTSGNTTYTCALRGEIAGASIGVILGGEYISGPGVITCRSGDNTQTVPVRMRLIGFGPAFDLSIIRSIEIRSANVQVTGGTDALLTNYSLGATAGATLIHAGVEFDAAAKVSGAGGVSFELAFQGRDVLGLGAHLYGMGFSIEPR